MLFLFLVFFLSASIFPSADAQSECGGERTCRPFFSVKGFICDCGFPKIYKDGKCVIDAGYSPFGGVLLLENEWKAKYTDVMSVEYIEISTAISAMFEVAFKNSFIYLSAIVEDLSTGTSKVGIQFNVNIEASVSVDEYVTLVKSSLGGSPVATLPGLVELKMNLNSLVISKTLLTCSKVNTCTSGPDSLGLCIDDPVLGPTCTCSPGFEDKNGICVDINECANPKACLVNGATCSNLVGSFVCACPGGLLSTPFGCIDFKPNADPCTDVAVKAAALGLGASCRKALNEKGYIFGCDFPLVAPQTADDTACIPVTSSKLKAASYQFDLAGIKWSDALKDSLSLEYLQVVHNVQLLVDTTLKVPGCSCSNKNSLDTSLANVLKVVNTENDKVSVVVELQKDDSTVVDKIVSATVPSVGITVTKVKKSQDLSLVVSATACGKDTCDADSICTSVASLTGFACACPFPRVRDSSGKCSLDGGRKPTAGQIVLANPWSDSLLDASSEASILLRTSVYSLFESFFTSVEPTFSVADVSFTITKDSSSTGISIKFLYTISQTITEASVISSITDLFGKTDGASYVSLVDLKLKMTTLTSGPKLLKCADADLCSTAGDKFALCTDDAEKGPVCACSSGFEAKNGICVDIDECSNPLPCLVADATCTNTPGSFDCVCPAGYVSSPAGCLAVSPTSDPCSASSAVQKCLGFGASCFKNLSPDGFSCQCAFPLVPSKTDDSCVLFESTGLTAATYDLTLSGVTMSAKLKDVLSVEYLQLQAQVSTLLNTVLKEPGCPCSSDGPLDKSVGTLVSVAEVDTAVTVTTQVFLSNLEVIDLLKNAAVPGVDITVTAVKQKSIDKIVVQSDACSTPTAKAECGERLCLPAANLVGYVCDCEVPKVFLDGKCTIAPNLAPIGAQVTLTNAWTDAYTTKSTADYIKISTAITDLLQLAFKDVKVSIVSLFKDTTAGSPTVGVKFVALADTSVTAEVLTASVKAVFGSADTYEFPAVVPLTVKVGTLEVKKTSLTCSDVKTCTSGGDLFAGCKDDPKLGPKCSCSSGFELKNDICVDIDECLANPCGANGVCTNDAGSFSCICKDGFISSPIGCISTTPPATGCSPAAKTECVALGGVCATDLSKRGYICQCEFPLVASRKVGENLCVPITDLGLMSKDYLLVLSGVTWSDKFADIASVESAVLASTVKKLVNTVLKDDTCPCSSDDVLDKSIASVTKFEKDGESVKVMATFLTTASTKVDAVVNAAVPGVDIKVSAAISTGGNSLVISPLICDTEPAKTECGKERKCIPVADSKGYACECEVPKVFKDGACIIDAGLVPIGGSLILTNEWKSSYADVKSNDYVKLSTTILSLLSLTFKDYTTSLVSIYEDKSSAKSTIAFKFIVNAPSSVMEADLTAAVKALFGSADTVIFRGLVELTLSLSSLDVGGSAVQCEDVNLCTTGGDTFATCKNDPSNGPTCTCSSGFKDESGVCKDVDECTLPSPCNAVGAKCTNLPGSFECECPPAFIDSPDGCIDPVAVTKADPCSDKANSAKCLDVGGTCTKDLSDLGFSCRCEFPLVASPKGDNCISIKETALKSVKYKLELKGVDWVEELTNKESAQALVLVEKVQMLVNTVLKDQLTASSSATSSLERSVVSVVSFEKKGAVVVSEVEVLLEKQSLIDQILNAAVPGIDLSVGAITKISEQTVIVNPDICSTPAAKTACGSEATCGPAVNELGFECTCPLKSIFKDAKCSLDETLAALAPLAVEITLGNVWAAAYGKSDSQEYITFKTAMSAVLSTIFEDKASFTGVVEEKSSGSSVVKAQFTVLVEKDVTADALVSKVKELFGNKDSSTVPGLIDITLKLSSLKADKPTCATLSTCAAGGDALAGCEDAASGPACKCSNGFADDNGVCKDVDECMDPKACGVDGAVCTNKPGSFDCKCPTGFIDSLNGCIDPIGVAAKDPCADLTISAKCVTYGATCTKDLSADFFSCRCAFPLVPSTVPGEELCVDASKAGLDVVDAKLELSGTTWSEKLADITTGEALVLKEQVEALINGVLKTEVSTTETGFEKSAATVVSFEKSATGVVAKVELVVKDKKDVDVIKDAKVAGIDIAVAAISAVADKALSVSPLGCSSTLAKDTCVADQECIITANDVGFVCACPVKTMLKDGACAVDPALADLVLLGAELTLTNSWKAEFADKKSTDYITTSTAVRTLLTTIFGEKGSLVALVEDASVVKIQFTVLVEKTVKAEDLVKQVKTVFTGTDKVKVAGLVELTLVVSSLKVDKMLLTCDSFTTCVSGGDDLAICVDGTAGPSCRCSTGFKEENGVCVDIDECALPNPCGNPAATCKNKQGGFDCACPDKYIPSLAGCVDVAISDIDPCIDGAVKCLAAGASCVKDISKQGYSCVCTFPLVFSPVAGIDLCVSITETKLVSADVKLELAGVTWSEDLADSKKAAALVLKDKVEELINDGLKDQTVESTGVVDKTVATVSSFEKTSTGVVAKVSVTVDDKAVISKVEKLTVAAIDVTIAKVTSVEEKALTIKSEICTTAVVKETCVTDQTCSVVVSESGFECSCPLKKLLKDGACVEDTALTSLTLLGAEVTLKNTWDAAYADTTSEKYIKITTSIKTVLTTVFGEQASFTAVVQDKTSVKAQFSVLVEENVKAEDLVSKFKAAFTGKDEATVPGIVELTLVTSSLTVDNSILTCDVLTSCAIGGDSLAICEGADGSAPYCRCSTGFEDINGVCKDIDECALPNPCGVPGTGCTNKPGSFDCACGSAYLPSLVGCVDTAAVTASDPCVDKKGNIKCLAAGATCVKDLSSDGYSCVCEFPLVFSPDVGVDKCVAIGTAELKSVDAKLDLKGITWTDKLTDLTTAEALIAKDKVEELVNSILKDQTTASGSIVEKTVASVRSFEKSSSGVTAAVSLTVKDEAVVEKLKGVVVTGNDVSVGAVTTVKQNALIVDGQICTSTAAKTACGTEQSCTAVASAVGYECSCGLKKVLEKGSCVPDAAVADRVPLGAELTLTNAWVADFETTTSTKYIEITTAITTVLTSVFGESSSLTAIVKEGSSVKIQFAVLVESTVTSETVVENFKGAFEKTEKVTVPGIVELTLLTSSLKVDAALLTCETFTTCSLDADAFAVCGDSDKGPVCRCSVGFEEVNGVCVDVNECDKPNSCGVGGSGCSNKPGGFDCKCSSNYLPSLVGCVDVAAVTKADPCADPVISAKCLLLGAKCEKNLSPDGYSCRCAFPLVASPDAGVDKCVAITETELVSADVEIKLKGATWSEDLANVGSAAAVILADKTEKLINIILAEQTTSGQSLDKTVADVKSFKKTDSSVTAEISVTVKDKAVIDTIKEVPVPGIDVSVAEITKVEANAVTVNAAICTSTVAKTACVPDQTCAAVASESGFECSCSLKTILKDGSCVEDTTLSSFSLLAAEITLKNTWQASYATVTSPDYISFTTAVKDVLSAVFGKEQSSFTSLVKVDSSVKVQFSVLAEASVTTKEVVDKVKAAFTGKDEAVVPGLVELTLQLSTLKVGDVLPSCDVLTTCTIAGDLLAICELGSKGPYCSCTIGFEEVNGVCTDIDECAKPNACGVAGAACVNTKGGFTCTCPANYLPSLVGCIDVPAVNARDPCSDPAITVKCLATGGTCEKDLSAQGYTCRCQHPLVSSPDSGADKCISVVSSAQAVASVKLDLKAVGWTEELADATKAPALILADKVEELVGAVFKAETVKSTGVLEKTVANVKSFEKTATGVSAEVDVTLPKELLDKSKLEEKLKDVQVPAIDLTVAAVTSVDVADVVVDSAICSTPKAAKECGMEATCSAVASDTGFECQCGLKTLFESGKCVEDKPKLDFVAYGAELQLTNAWSAKLADTTTKDYVLFKTSVVSALTSVFGSAATFSEIVESKVSGSSAVLMKYSLLLASTEKVDTYKSKITAAFAEKSSLTVPGLVDLTLTTSSLKIDKSLLTCDMLTSCVAKEDSLAICEVKDQGPACRCSTGFKEENGVCLDIDECAVPDSCGAPSTKCTNIPGGFNCACSSSLLTSLVGCVDPVKLAAEACDGPAVTKCLGLGSACAADLSDTGYLCRCEFPLIASQNDGENLCVPIATTEQKAVEVKLDLKGVEWSEKLDDIKSPEAIILKDKVEELVNNVLKEESACTCGAPLDKGIITVEKFEQTTSGAVAAVTQINVKEEATVMKVKDVDVPGIDIKVSAVSTEKVKDVVIDPKICTSTKPDCASGQSCAAVVSDTGFLCSCPLKTILSADGKCVEDVTLTTSKTLAVELSLANLWKADYKDTTKEEFVKITTAVRSVLSGIFKEQASFTSLVEDASSGSSVVKVKFEALADASTTAEKFVMITKEKFGTTDPLVVPGLVDLSLKISTLIAKVAPLDCDKSTCKDGGDTFALCVPGDNGFTCECSRGFQDVKGVCKDIDECDKPNPCGNPLATCTNKLGTFDCVCPDGFLSSLKGCIKADQVSLASPCVDTSNVAKCLPLGGTCAKDLSEGLFSCQCEFPLVPSTVPGEDKCVSVLTTTLKVATYKLDITGATWTDKLSDAGSAEALILADKVTTLVDTILKDQLISSDTELLDTSITQVDSFVKSTTGVVAEVTVALADQTAIERVKNVVVNGIDVSISKVTKVDNLELLFLPEICDTSAAKDECAKGSKTCVPALNDKGYDCVCDIPKVLVDDTCTLVTSARTTGGQFILSNEWSALYSEVKSESSVTIKTALSVLVKKVLGESVTVAELFEDKSTGSSTVGVKVVDVLTDGKTDSKLVEDVKAVFNTEVYTAPGLVELFIRSNTVKFSESLLTCKIAPTCTAGGDAFALCSDPADGDSTGSITCKCSPGFAATNGICSDVNECAKPDVCGSGNGCKNVDGFFSCDCGASLLSSGQGCIDPVKVTAAEAYSDPAKVSKCLTFGAKCSKDISADFSTCSCEFPLVASSEPGKDTCVSVEKENTKIVDARLTLSNVKWTDSLKDKNSAEALVLAEKVKRVADTVLKKVTTQPSSEELDKSVAVVKGFVEDPKVPGVVAADVELSSEKTKVDDLVNAEVPGVDIQVAAVTNVEDKQLVVKADACTLPAATDECGPNRLCVAAANDKGFVCLCGAPRVEVNGECIIDPSLSVVTGTISLSNDFTPALEDTKSAEYIKFSSSVTTTLTTVLGSSFSLVSLKKSETTSKVDVSFVLQSDLKSKTVDKVTSEVKANFGATDRVVPGLVDITLKMDSLKLDPSPKCSTANTCAAAGDKAATCTDAADVGISCTCSSGFEAINGICTDIKACEKTTCGVYVCTSKAVDYKCEPPCAPPKVSVLGACIDVKSEECSKPDVTSVCSGLSGACKPELNDKGYSCSCAAPLVASQKPGEDKCVPAATTGREFVSLKLELGKETFTEALKDKKSTEARALEAQVKGLLNKALKDDTCTCSSNAGSVDKSIAMVEKFEKGTTGVSATVQVLVPEKTTAAVVESKVKNNFIAGTEVLVTSVEAAPAKTIDVAVCTTATCGQDQTCVPTALDKGYICQCVPPKILKDGNCVIDAEKVSAYGGELQLTNTWSAAFDDKSSDEYKQLVGSTNTMLQFLSSSSATLSFSSIVQEKSAVKIKFLTSLDSAQTAEQFVAKVKTDLGGNRFVALSATTLKLDLDSLTVSKKLLKCGEVNLCTALDDKFALCDDSADAGAVCTCSEGFKLVNGFCKDIDECSKPESCNSAAAVCSNKLGYFDCGCSAGQLLSKDGCLDVSSTTDPCDAAATKTCEDLGAVCKKSLSKDGFQCQCALPKVAAQDGTGKCVDGVTTTDYRLDITGATWSEALASDFSKEFVALKAKLQKYLNTVLKFSSCACSSTEKLDQSVAVVNSFVSTGLLTGQASSSAVSAVVSVVSQAEAKISSLSGTAVSGIDIIVSSANKLALVTSADVCSSAKAKADCVGGTQCLPFANEAGFICTCTFPQIFSKSAQLCQTDPAFTAATGSFVLANTWSDDYADKKSSAYIKLFSSVSSLIRSTYNADYNLFKVSSIEKDAAGIKVSYSLSIDSTKTVESVLTEAKARFGSTEVFSFAVGTDLKLRASTLTLTKAAPNTCASNSCTSAGDTLALCDDGQAGVKCTCSEGFAAVNGVCKDVDECATGGCGSSACTNTGGSFSCECAGAQVSSKDGCIDLDSTTDTCTTAAITACQAFNAVCKKSLLKTGYQCECAAPNGPAPDGSQKCVPGATTSEFKLELSGVTWSTELATDFSKDFIVLKKKLQRSLNTALKSSGCPCSSTGVLDQSVATVGSFLNSGLASGSESSTAVAAIVSVASSAAGGIEDLATKDLTSYGIDIKVTKASKLALVYSTKVCATAGCSAGKACQVFANDVGYVCDCAFPTVPKDGSCVIDSKLTAIPGSLVLENAWSDDFTNAESEAKIKLYSSVSYMLQAIFKTRSFSINSVAKEDLGNGASGVKVVFSLNIDAASTPASVLETSKKGFGQTAVFSFAVIMNLRLRVSSLNLSPKVVTCNENNICKSGGDKYALCDDTPDGPFCTCSPGFVKKNAICVDIDECLTATSCGAGTCNNKVGSFECVCPAGQVTSPDGCITPDNTRDFCADGGTSDCQKFNAVCKLGLYKKGYNCECQLPLVPSPTDQTCIDQSQTNLTTKTYDLNLKGVAWKEEFANESSTECKELKQQTQKACNTVLKYGGCPCTSTGDLNRGVAQCKGFKRSGAAGRRLKRQAQGDGVTAIVQLSLFPGADLNKLVDAVIPGLPFTIGSIKSVNPAVPTQPTTTTPASPTDPCNPNPCTSSGDSRATCMQKENAYVCACSIPFYEFSGTSCTKKKFFGLLKGSNIISIILNFILFFPTFIVNLILQLAKDFPIGRALDQQWNGRHEMIENIVRVFRG